MPYAAIGEPRSTAHSRWQFQPYADAFIARLAKKLTATVLRKRRGLTRHLRWSILTKEQQATVMKALTSKYQKKRQRMGKRPRPPIPLWVRIHVCARQLAAKGIPLPDSAGMNRKQHIEVLLRLLFGEDWTRAECDHRPALGLRDYNPRVKVLADRYTPNANDPNFLEYLLDDAHLERTAGKGGDLMRFGGDVREMTKGRNLRERPDLWRVRRPGKPMLKTPRKRKMKRQTKWPKGRKIQSRGFR